LDIKYLDDLENRVQSLINFIENIRQENDKLKQDLLDNSTTIAAMESENSQLKQELDALKNDTIENKSKLETVTERIQGILTRLETVN
jgi:chromosome segregation ATPase